ncbi:MAG: hypothetical protein LBL18_06035 [Bacteroidales bacterium]|jgi:hypothetical protein|nr:hypothetical protein [Bacteroidales bacterium]
MKKTILILTVGLWGGWLCAQEIPDCDYNPYRHKEWRETGFEDFKNRFFLRYLDKSCPEEKWKQLKEEFYSKNEFHVIMDESLMDEFDNCHACSDIVDFLEYIIDNSTNEKTRIESIEILRFRFQYDAIPFLLNHLTKKLSIKEQLSTARALMTLGEKTKSMEIFERHCYNMEEMCDECFFNYQFTNNEQAAIRYFNCFFDKPQCKIRAACELARYGIVDKTFPIFMEALAGDDGRASTTALVGLAAIGTPECLDIIKRQYNHHDMLTGIAAKQIIQLIIKTRRDKCGN